MTDKKQIVMDIGNSFDAEIIAIEAIPKILKDLNKQRKLALLEYILTRYKSGDNFGIE